MSRVFSLELRLMDLAYTLFFGSAAYSLGEFAPSPITLVNTVLISQVPSWFLQLGSEAIMPCISFSCRVYVFGIHFLLNEECCTSSAFPWIDSAGFLLAVLLQSLEHQHRSI